MLPLLTLALLTQAPSPAPRTVAVLATSKRPGVDQFVATLTARVHALLAREGVGPLLAEAAGAEQLRVAGVTDPRSCQGARGCVSRMALILGARTVVVGIDIGKAGASLAVLMEAVAADDEHALVTSEFAVPIASFSDASALPVALFARQLKAKLDAERPVAVVVVTRPVPDAPTIANLEPPPVPPPAVTAEATSPTSARRVAAWTTGGGAVLAAGSAVALALVGNGAKGQIDGSLIPGSSPPTSSLPGSQLKSLEGRANGAFTGALVSGVAAGALAAVSVYCFASEP